MKEKKYEPPIMEVVEFEETDVIVTSPGTPPDPIHTEIDW